MVRLKAVDITYDTVAGGVWTDIEPSVAIVAACLPIMRPVVRQLIGDHSARIHGLRRKENQIPSDGSGRFSGRKTVSSGRPTLLDDCEMQGRGASATATH